MPDVPVTKETQSRGLTKHDESYPGFRSRGPHDLFSMNPFEMMRRFTDEMDRWFEGGTAGRGAGLWSPRIEVVEKENRLIVSADLPGIDKENVKVEVAADGLLIQGERKHEHEQRGSNIYRCEREYGQFSRLIPLPEGAEIDNIKAQFNNGVLEVTVPISESQRRRRQIPIEAEMKARTSGGRT